jgi:hypothetical protein
MSLFAFCFLTLLFQHRLADDITGAPPLYLSVLMLISMQTAIDRNVKGRQHFGSTSLSLY